MDEVYKKLETPEGERKIYRIAKARDKSAKDFTQIRQIKVEQGVVLWEHDCHELSGETIRTSKRQRGDTRNKEYMEAIKEQTQNRK